MERKLHNMESKKQKADNRTFPTGGQTLWRRSRNPNFQPAYKHENMTSSLNEHQGFHSQLHSKKSHKMPKRTKNKNWTSKDMKTERFHGSNKVETAFFS